MLNAELVNQAIGTQLDPITFSYTKRDAVLYALGVGAPADWLDADELKFVYELSPNFAVLPSLPVIYSGQMIESIVSGEIAGIRFNPMMLVHGEQYLEIRAELPLEGTITCYPTLSQIYDKGSGMLMVTDVDCRDASGRTVAMTQSSMFIRGLGGYGGERGPSVVMGVPPDRAADQVHQEKTLERQALIYRLSGDINPLHADPQMAALGQFDRPILHGLCTFGFAVRAVLKHFCDNDPARFESVRVRFSKHVFPGETLVTEMWRSAEHEITFQTRALERDVIVLSNAVATIK